MKNITTTMKYNLINRAEPPMLPPVLPSATDVLLKSKADEQEKLITKINADTIANDRAEALGIMTEAIFTVVSSIISIIAFIWLIVFFMKLVNIFP